MLSRIQAIVLACAICIIPSAAWCNEWFKSAGVSCSGSRALGDALSTLNGTGLTVKTGTGIGNYYVRLPVASAFTISKDQITRVRQLDKSSSQSLRALFQRTSEQARVPSFVTVTVTLSTGLLLPGSVGLPADLIFDYFFSKINSIPVSIRDVSLFIVEGGEIYARRSIVRRSDGNVFLSASSEYRVALGKENRTFVVHGCAYPIEVIVQEFYTAGTGNDKALRPSGRGQWRIWDAVDKRYTGAPLTYLYQSAGYYYFEQDAIERDKLVGKHLHRLSFVGGSWQRLPWEQRPSGEFRTLYPKVNAR